MPLSPDGSSSISTPSTADSRVLLRRLADDDSVAAQQIFDRYLHRLLKLAASRLSNRLRRRLDEHDILHGSGIIHCDLKPANFLIDRSSARGARILLSDFGFSRRHYSSSQTMLAGGTLAYMPPEQKFAAAWSDWQVTPASDVFALGAILYALLFFKPPDENMHRRLKKIPLPPAVQKILKKSLAFRREDRFQSAPDLLGAVLDALKTLQA